MQRRQKERTYVLDDTQLNLLINQPMSPHYPDFLLYELMNVLVI